ncbi:MULTISPECIES: NUDIX hydrolase N-terminal domain-containing protein [Nocardiopsis]|uniref:NUDIX hydrolase N-terminal domain-containing protein n=1 Tax=Nocardiopsis TaxID=2013 RepID=UPI0003796813|nr:MULTISPECIES: NUDIX hydrolase N-terminal domain-containing protein [Nocardiopsis]ASU56662.1 ADP-ribose pyrophosphatase [Nocardiopsis dassonvillei]
MTEPAERIRRIAMELTAQSESGLAYSTNEFDIGRFHRVGALARDLMQMVAAGELPGYEREVASAAGYTTPKLDVRGGVFDPSGRVLLVREISDGHRWTLPGGWCDVLESPRQAIEREVREEAGLAVRAVHLAGVLDRHLWPHVPVYDRHIYKLLFVCAPLTDPDPASGGTGTGSPAFSGDGTSDRAFSSAETSARAWFDVDDLPELSVSRVLPEQIALLHRHWMDPGPAHID